jgi:hypothetical protein
MKRIAIGAVTGLAVWFGSALAAEAQQITPTGPLCYTSGSLCSNYSATIYLPTPMTYKMVTSLYKNGVWQTTFSQIVPNPGVNTSTFNQVCLVSFSVYPGDVVTYSTQLLWNRTTTNGPDWSVTVNQGTSRPSSKPSSVAQRTSVAAKGTGLKVENIDNNRRREW